MRILFESVELAGFTEAVAHGVSVNGSIVFEAVDIVRAAKKRVYARGNQLVNLSFSVRRHFATVKECETYLLTHFSLLPKSGVCLIECGTDGGDITEVFLANAVLAASPQGVYGGVSAEVAYQIVAPEATTDTPPGVVLPIDVTARGTVELNSPAESVAVVFDDPFGDLPVVVAVVVKPEDGDNIWPTLRDVTTNGFTADFQAPIPDEGYVLHWIAIG